jgi:osmotically-inducible protein OsmY
MNKFRDLLIGMAMGAGMMYLLDPGRGARRRALIRDQVVHGAHEIEDLGDQVAAKARHLRNRARGKVVETRNRRLKEREEVPDAVLEARVRSELGRVVANMSDILISAEHGRVTLRGTASAADVEKLVEEAQAVPGVHDVINRLEVRESTG